MKTEVKRYKVRIFGELYSIVSDAQEDCIADIVYNVDSIMKDIAAKNDALDTKKVAVLALLKVYEELSQLQQAVHNQQHLSLKIMNMIAEDPTLL